MLGRHSEAVAAAQHARQVDPFNTEIGTFAVLVFSWAREYDLALREALKVLEIDPTLPRTHFELSVVYTIKGMNDAAAREYELALGSGPEASAAEKAYRAEGIRGIYRWQLHQETRTYASSTSLALAYAFLGQDGQALSCLEQAYHERDSNLLFLKADPRFDRLRSSPRFQDVMRRMNFPAKSGG
jgi:tetratricopeptide (TPR) repeat protein